MPGTYIIRVSESVSLAALREALQNLGEFEIDEINAEDLSNETSEQAKAWEAVKDLWTDERYELLKSRSERWHS